MAETPELGAVPCKPDAIVPAVPAEHWFAVVLVRNPVSFLVQRVNAFFSVGLARIVALLGTLREGARRPDAVVPLQDRAVRARLGVLGTAVGALNVLFGTLREGARRPDAVVPLQDRAVWARLGVVGTADGDLNALNGTLREGARRPDAARPLQDRAVRARLDVCGTGAAGGGALYNVGTLREGAKRPDALPYRAGVRAFLDVVVTFIGGAIWVHKRLGTCVLAHASTAGDLLLRCIQLA